MDQATKDRISDRNIWVRALYALFFAITYAVARTVLTLIVVFQFLAALITGKVNDALLRFGTNMNTYVYQILQFMTFNEETLPFPFSDWPDEQPGSQSPWVRAIEDDDEQDEDEDKNEGDVQLEDEPSQAKNSSDDS